MGASSLSSWEQNQVRELYGQGLDGRTVAVRLGRNCKTIYRYLRGAGLTRSTGEAKRTHSLNQEVFAFVNQKAAYWGGFIAADGSVDERGRLRVSLQDGDLGHLQALRTFLETSTEIKRHGEYPELVVRSSKLVTDLSRNFGVVPRKSYTFIPPDMPDWGAAVAFWRGYFDGNGCISIRQRIQGNLTGTRAAVCEFARLILGVEKRVYPHGAAWRVMFNRHQVALIARTLYVGAPEGFRLERKYQLAQELLN